MIGADSPVVGVLGAFALGPIATDLVYDVELSGRMLALVSASPWRAP